MEEVVLLCTCASADDGTSQTSTAVPPPLCSQLERPDKSEAIIKHQSRFIN